jgi:hypothetical protein
MKFSVDINLTSIFVLVGRIQLCIFLVSLLVIGLSQLPESHLGLHQAGLLGTVALLIFAVTLTAKEGLIKAFYILQGVLTLALLGWLAM